MRMHGMKPKYYHHLIGGNFRLDAIQAAVLNVKLPHLDSWSRGRQRNAALYTELMVEKGLATGTGETIFDEKNKVLIPKAVYEASGHPGHHIYNQFVIRVERRNALRDFLTQNEIMTEIYYPVPFHRQECFKYLNPVDEDYPISNCASTDSLALPIYPELTTEQITFTVSKIAEFQSSASQFPLECKHCDCMKNSHR